MASPVSRRFRDLAALVDLTEEESEYTATTSYHIRTNTHTLDSNCNININSNSNSNNNTLSFADRLQSQKHHIERQHSREEAASITPSNCNSHSPKPHLSAFLLQQHSKQAKSQGSSSRSSSRSSSGYPTQILYADSTAALDGDQQSQFSSPKSTFHFSSTELSMEAEAGKFWEGSTAQRQFSSHHRIEAETTSNNPTSSGSLFRSRLNHRFRSKPSRAKEASEQQQPQMQPQRQPNTSFQSYLSTNTTDTSKMSQPRELVLNSTDSTDSCTLSATSHSHSHSHSHSQSHSNSQRQMQMHSQVPVRPTTDAPIDRNLSYELPSPQRSSVVSPPREAARDELDVGLASEEASIPSWKLKQRQKMRERMRLLESPSLEQPQTPPRGAFCQEEGDEELLLSPAMISPVSPPRELTSQASLQPPEVPTHGWKARQFRRTFRHRAQQKRERESNHSSSHNHNGNNSSTEESQAIEPVASVEEINILEQARKALHRRERPPTEKKNPEDETNVLEQARKALQRRERLPAVQEAPSAEEVSILEQARQALQRKQRNHEEAPALHEAPSADELFILEQARQALQKKNNRGVQSSPSLEEATILEQARQALQRKQRVEREQNLRHDPLSLISEEFPSPARRNFQASPLPEDDSIFGEESPIRRVSSDEASHDIESEIPVDEEEIMGPPSPVKRLRNVFEPTVETDEDVEEEQEMPRGLPSPMKKLRNVFEPTAETDEDAEEEQEVPRGPPSPVKKLRDLFESNKHKLQSSSNRGVQDSDSTMAHMDDPSVHEQRRKNHRVVAYPQRSLSREATLEKQEQGEPTKHAVVAYPPHHDQRQASAESMVTEEAPENDGLLTESTHESLTPAPEPPAAWWTEMTEKVNRYHRSVKHKALGSSQEDLRKAFEVFAENQNQLGRAMAVALFQGMELVRAEEEAKHGRELRELRDQHEQELEKPRQQTTKLSPRTSGSVTNATSRNEAFRQRWKNRMSHNQLSSSSRHDAATEVASTVVSNMSCRELSVERYRARILQQMNRGKKSRAASVVAPSVSMANYSIDGAASEISVPVSDASSLNSTNKKNAQEIQRLLDELQQAERRQKLLEKQLQQAGVVLAEDIPYQEAKDKVASISKRMNEIGSSEVVHEDPLIQKQLREEYFRLEKDMEKYLSALMLTDEFAEEQRLAAEAWESKHAVANQTALAAVRRHMPVDIRTLGPQQLESDRGLPKKLVQKFRRTNVLQLLRVDPQVVAKWHPSTLEAFRVTGLTLTERRALHAYLKPIAIAWRGKADGEVTSSTDPMTNRKLAWVDTMTTNFKEALNRYEQHVGGTNGVPRRHIHSTCLANRCNLVGNQCPVRANRSIDYLGGDLGFPAGGIYETPVLVVARDAQAEESPEELIARARQQPKNSHVYESPIRSKADLSRPVILPTKKKTPLRNLPTRPKHPLLAKGPAKPDGLLAAIAARRID